MEGATWNITYGDGSHSSGSVYVDTVSIGGVTVENQAIESAQQVSASFGNNTASDGLVGLAMGKLNTIKPTAQKTFFENALANLAMPLFSANLKKAEAGNYNFGFIDKTEFTGDLTFINANTTRGFWEFEADGYAVSKSGTPAAAAQMQAMPHLAIADTGTTLLLLPPDIVRGYYAQVPTAQNSTVAGGFVFDCGEQLPDITLAIDSYMSIVQGELINYAPVGTGNLCYGGIQAADGLPFSIYGDIWFKSQFVVFQGGAQPRLGFAPQATT